MHEFSYDALLLGPWLPTFRKHQLPKHEEPLIQQHSAVSPKAGILTNDAVRTANLTSELKLENVVLSNAKVAARTATPVVQKPLNVT